MVKVAMIAVAAVVVAAVAWLKHWTTTPAARETERLNPMREKVGKVGGR